MGPDRLERQKRARRRAGLIWLQRRPRAWIWAVGLVVVVLVVALWLYAGSAPVRPA